MPIYEYQCKQCSRRFEVRHHFTDNIPTYCPSCGGEAYHCFSPVPIVFKGSGFYTTDSRRKNDSAEKEKLDEIS